jgi:hypothetical protein
MGWNDHIDWDRLEVIQQAIEEGLIGEGTVAHGVALKTCYEGYEELSPKQRYAYDRHVLPAIRMLGERQRIMDRCYNAPD